MSGNHEQAMERVGRVIWGREVAFERLYHMFDNCGGYHGSFELSGQQMREVWTALLMQAGAELSGVES